MRTGMGFQMIQMLARPLRRRVTRSTVDLGPCYRDTVPRSKRGLGLRVGLVTPGGSGHRD